ncbi:MAG: ubiquinol-cytochrome c reductase iron-sulfur subunit [Chloroflexi bacterium]|nr:ubiquinol-cytochrome c reductase iron-sulfur subunit [Chloroflexota bacterium]
MSSRNPHDLSRRDFFKIVGSFVSGIMGVMLGIPLISYFISPALDEQGGEKWIPAGPLENYPLGKPTLFTFTLTKQHGWEKTSQSYGVYIIRHSDTEVTVFSNVCTHLACRVRWKDELGEFVCPCHDAHFAETGEVISGPAPRPLDKYEYKIEDGILYIHLVEG